jgi:putative hydrolase of the HAD superfamily
VRLLLTDADNTLWDTNAVYANAQLRLLEKVEAHVGRSIEAEDRLGFVRGIDQSLALQHPKGLRYPPVLLAASILGVGVGQASSAQAVELSLAGGLSSEVAERFATELFDDVSTSVPDLRLGVRETLSYLKREGVRIIVLTEGEEARCISLLKRHQIAQYVSSLKSVRKTFAVYRDLKSEWIGPAYMVGDQLDVDVQLARAAGFTSVYFPSEFVPSWTSNLDNEADFTIASYAEIPDIVAISGR